MSFLNWFFSQNPLLPLFLALAIGFVIGRIPFGSFRLGGVAGSLIAGVVISLFIQPVHQTLLVNGAKITSTVPIINDPLKNILFAIFIFAVGFQSGPAFFRSLGRKTIREIILAVVLAVTALLTVWGVSEFFHFGKGLAAGVASGGLTQSAILGVSTDAMSKMGMSANELATQTANVGVGYAVTYIFGSLVTIFICANLLPAFMGKNLHDAAIEEVEENPEAYKVQKETESTKEVALKTDITILGLGVFIGLIIGLLVWRVGGVPITLGSGGGALLSGLFFGWLKGKKPELGGDMPAPMLAFMSDFGLGGFVAAVGLNAGNLAIKTIAEKGVSIFIAGLIVTIVPLIITMLVGKWILRYKNAAVFAGALSGSRSANPAFGQVLESAGNSVPTVSFAVTYALANVFLTVLGPIIVAIVH